jgi:iron(III) transport system substrate-binding protein
LLGSGFIGEESLRLGQPNGLLALNHPLAPHRSLLACALAVAALAAGGCGFSTEDSGAGGGEPEAVGITLYSGRIPAAIGPAVDAYEARARRDVQVRFADTADLAATLVEEGDASPADAFFAQEPGAIAAVADAGLLAELPPDVLASVAPRFRDPAGHWVGVTGRARIVAYDRADVKPAELPPSPFGLTAPRWRNRVGWSPASSSMQEYVTALRARYGDDRTREWLEAMVANGAEAFPDNVSIRDAIAGGEIDVGLINHYYVAQAIAAEGPGYPVGVYFPPGGLGSLMLLTSVGVLESSDRKDEAFDFVRSLLADRSQEFLTSSSKEYPLARGARPDPSLSVPIAEIPVSGNDLVDLTELQATVELMQESGAL